MIKVNSARVIQILDNTKECFHNTKSDINLYNENKDNQLLCGALERAIRHDIADIFKNLEDYLALILKTAGIGISKKSFKKALISAKEENLIDKDFAVFMEDKIIIRNYFSHRYKYPTTQALIEFYLDNEELFNKHITFIENISNDLMKDNVSLF